MAQGFLDDLQISPIRAEARREGVPEHVRVNVQPHDRLDHPLHEVIDPPLADRLPVALGAMALLRVYEHIRGFSARWSLSALDLLGLYFERRS